MPAIISTVTNDPTRSLVTKYVAYALKSRICLFEGTFRKYHTELNLQGTASTWLDQAATAAKYVMDNGGYSIYTTGGPGKSYRTVFTNATPIYQRSNDGFNLRSYPRCT